VAGPSTTAIRSGLPILRAAIHPPAMGTKSRETIYGASVRAAAAAKEADKLACAAWNKRMLALLIFLGVLCFENAPFALAASDCSMSATLANWGEKSTASIAVAPKESCQFPLKLSGTIDSSEISQKPSRGKLKKINASTYQYTATARYRGTDTFAIKATGKDEKASGISEISVQVTIK
jgi:hypothetical protein